VWHTFVVTVELRVMHYVTILLFWCSDTFLLPLHLFPIHSWYTLLFIVMLRDILGIADCDTFCWRCSSLESDAFIPCSHSIVDILRYSDLMIVPLSFHWPITFCSWAHMYIPSSDWRLTLGLLLLHSYIVTRFPISVHHCIDSAFHFSIALFGNYHHCCNRLLLRTFTFHWYDSTFDDDTDYGDRIPISILFATYIPYGDTFILYIPVDDAVIRLFTICSAIYHLIPFYCSANVPDSTQFRTYPFEASDGVEVFGVVLWVFCCALFWWWVYHAEWWPDAVSFLFYRDRGWQWCWHWCIRCWKAIIDCILFWPVTVVSVCVFSTGSDLHYYRWLIWYSILFYPMTIWWWRYRWFRYGVLNDGGDDSCSPVICSTDTFVDTVFHLHSCSIVVMMPFSPVRWYLVIDLLLHDAVVGDAFVFFHFDITDPTLHLFYPLPIHYHSDDDWCHSPAMPMTVLQLHLHFDTIPLRYCVGDILIQVTEVFLAGSDPFYLFVCDEADIDREISLCDTLFSDITFYWYIHCLYCISVAIVITFDFVFVWF